MKMMESEGYHFDYAPSGRFTMVNKEGEDLTQILKKLFTKLLSHILWAGIWAFFFFTFAFKLFLSLVLLHLFLFSFRLTQFFLQGGFRPLFFPPLWERISRKLEKNAQMDLLLKYGLEKHLGLLHNLRLYSKSLDSKGD